MCTVSFNCHQNVAIGIKTIPQSTQKCYHRSPTTKKWKHALLPEPFNHWPLACIYIYIWNLTWGCDVTDTDVSEGTGSKSVCSNAVLHPIMPGLEKTTQFTKSEHRKKKRLKGMLFISTKHNMWNFGFSPLTSHKWHLKRRIFWALDMKTMQLNQKQISVLCISFFTV